MEWTREKTLALINEYRKRRGLWDMTHDDYRKKDVKQNLLVEVSNSLGGNIPVGEIEKKFHTLRTQYHREINRMKRKEPYNSKWFGFKNLQFLSSPMARRLSRGRIKNEITEDGTVTTKYIIKDSTNQQHENSASSANSSNNMNEEFLTIHQKPTITIVETLSNNRQNASRSRALEKLIEETTKDVEEIDDKSKMSISIGHQNYSDLEEAVHHSRNDTEPQPMEEVDERIETVHLHGDDDEEISYPQSTGGEVIENASNIPTIVHHGQMPTQIIKIRRHDTSNETEFYDDESQQHPESKRVFYETPVQQHSRTIVTSTPSPTSHSTTTLVHTKIKPRSHKRQLQLQGRNLDESNNVKSSQVTRSTDVVRDEFTTYGEYVSNEMRNITNREVLLGLKHKINTALFEAQMAELQK